MMNINQINSSTIKVESYGILDKLLDTLPCFTREGESEVIIDIEVLDPEQFKQLGEIVGASEDTPLPDSGYAHFWK